MQLQKKLLTENVFHCIQTQSLGCGLKLKKRQENGRLLFTLHVFVS